jgi:hypothetical protein
MRSVQKNKMRWFGSNVNILTYPVCSFSPVFLPIYEPFFTVLLSWFLTLKQNKFQIDSNLFLTTNTQNASVSNSCVVLHDMTTYALTKIILRFPLEQKLNVS